jgi:tetratricopeptide (TPR) repeat protein
MARATAALACVLLVVGCPNPRAVDKEKLSKTRYLLGKDYLAKKQPGPAVAELLGALELDPNNGDAARLVGQIYFIEGVHAQDYKDREGCLSGRAADDQDSLVTERFRSAEKQLTRAVDLGKAENRIESDALTYLSNIALHFGRHAEAITLAGRALENVVYSGQHIALAARAWGYYRKGQLAAAARDLRQALFYRPDFCLGRFRLAKVYLDEKQAERAVEELERVTALPQKQTGWNGSCCRVCDAGCPCGDQCIPCAEKCEKPAGCACKARGCGLQEALQLLGLAYQVQNRTAKAREFFLRCVSLNPKSCIAIQCERYAKLI